MDLANNISAEQKKLVGCTSIRVKPDSIKATPEKKGANVAREWVKEKYPDGEIVKSVVGDIKINQKRIKNSLSHKFSQKKLDCVTSVVDGMKQASYITTIPDYDDKCVTHHYFVYKVDYNGTENYVLCRIKEQDNHRKFYIHEVGTWEEIKKMSNSLQTQADGKSHETLRGIALYASILSNFLGEINEIRYNQKGGENAKTAALDKLNLTNNLSAEQKKRKDQD